MVKIGRTVRRVLGSLAATVAIAPLVFTATAAAAAPEPQCGKKFKIAEADSGVSKATLYSQKCKGDWRLSGTLYDTKVDDRAAIVELYLYEKDADGEYSVKRAENGKGANSSKSFSFNTRGSLDIVVLETLACSGNFFAPCSDRSPYEDARPKG